MASIAALSELSFRGDSTQQGRMSGYQAGGSDYYDSVDPAPKTGWKAYVPTAVRYVLALVLLVVLDAFWMGLIAPLLGIKYFDIVEGIQNSPIAKRWEGLFAYLVLGYAAAFMTRGKTGAESALQGAQIGFVIYAVFDFTTTFMFHGWGLKVAVLDTIWGTLMYTLIGFLLYFVETTSLWQRL